MFDFQKTPHISIDFFFENILEKIGCYKRIGLHCIRIYPSSCPVCLNNPSGMNQPHGNYKECPANATGFRKNAGISINSCSRRTMCLTM